MKRQLTKALAFSLVLSMAFSLITALPAFAQTDTTQEASTAGQKESTVTINAGSNFKVTVPSTITVRQSSKAVLNETYNVKVEGDINGEQKVKVVPDETFNLSQSGKSDIPVTVSQPKTEFAYDEINGTNGCTTTGTLTTDTEVTAGTWTGNLTFNINVETQVIYDAGAGLYTTGTDTMIKSWSELLAEDTIHVENGVLTTNYVEGEWESPSSDALDGDLVIDSSVTSIGDNAFFRCSYLTSVTIPDSVTTIGDMAFWGCTNLTSITIGTSVTTIGDRAFENCDRLTSVTIGNGVTTIGDNAFGACTSLANITIPDSVTSIGYGAFEGCTNLTSVTLGNSVTTIGDSAFSSCGSLTNVTIPDSVTTIGDRAFASCTSLTSVTIGNNVTSIGDEAFINVCAEIHVPASVTSIGYNAFGGEFGNPGARNLIYYGDNLQIFNNTLGWSDSIQSFTIAGQATDVGNIFYDCYSIESIEVYPDNDYLSSENGVLFNKDKTKLIAYPLGKTDSTYTIPDTVTEIGDKAFYNCYNLTNVIIPDSVTTIGEYAFDYCTSLTSVTIPGSVTAIGDSAFSSCTSLTSVTIPDSVTTIGNSAFAECTSLTSVTIPDSVTTIGKRAFYMVPHIEYHGSATGSPWGADSMN